MQAPGTGGNAGQRTNPIDMWRYGANTPGASSAQIAKVYADAGILPPQLAPFIDKNAWAAGDATTRYQQLHYVLNNPYQYAPGGRQHADSPAIFSGGGDEGFPRIPGVNAPGTPPTGYVPTTPPGGGAPPGGGGGTGTPDKPAGGGGTQGGDGTESPAVGGPTGAPSGPGMFGIGPDVSATTAPTGNVGNPAASGAAPAAASGQPGTGPGGNANPTGDAPNAPGFPAANSFSTGGRFSNTPVGSFLGNPFGLGPAAGFALSTIAGQVPYAGPIATMMSGARNLELGLDFANKRVPNAMNFLGLNPQNPNPPQYAPDPKTGLYHTLPPVTPAVRASEAPPEEGPAPGGSQSAGPQSEPDAGVPAGTATVGEPSVSEGTPDTSGTGPGAGPTGTGVTGPGLGDVGLGGNVGLSGEPGSPGGPPGLGNIGEPGAPTTDVSISGVDTTGTPGESAPDAGDGGGGGGAGGGGGCYLATWALDALNPRDKVKAKKFFQQFYDGFIKLQGKTGKRLFSLYQLAAQNLMRAVQQRGPNEVKRAQQEIYDRLVVPTGRAVDAHEIPTAVKNLVSVVQDLSRRYGVALTPEMQKAAQTFTAGRQPGVFGRNRTK